MLLSKQVRPRSRPDANEHQTLPDQVNDATRTGFIRVLVLWDGGSVTRWMNPGSAISLGRSRGCDVRVDHASVSRLHAELRASDPPTIEDLGSSNGVRVRGERIPVRRPVPFRPGDVVELGSVAVLYQPPFGARPVDDRPTEPPHPVSASPMEAVEHVIGLVAKSDIAVLLLGETGVGKGVAARTIHERSPRAQRPLVRVNCPAFPEALLEGELFGYERGAFSGASQAKAGLIESAEGGTVFLDEIAEVSPAIQAKLLGLLDSREVQRLGSIKPRRVDVRFVAATNRDLEACVREGSFRADLYFRLSGVAVTIPPLRARRSEILSFARAFLAEACNGRRPVPPLRADAEEWLVAHDWPGNLRELRNLVERAAALTPLGAAVGIPHLVPPKQASSMLPPVTPAAEAPVCVPSANDGAALRTEIDALMRKRVAEALEACDGNQSKAAKMLGVSRGALLHRMAMYGLPRPRKR
jgi:two-component system, NtrC family, response regulator AtoC